MQFPFPFAFVSGGCSQHQPLGAGVPVCTENGGMPAPAGDHSVPAGDIPATAAEVPADVDPRAAHL